MLDPNKKLFRWGPISGCPLFMHYTIASSFKPLKQNFGVSYSYSHVIFKEKKVTWLLDNQEFYEASKVFSEKHIFDEKNGDHLVNCHRRRKKMTIFTH